MTAVGEQIGFVGELTGGGPRVWWEVCVAAPQVRYVENDGVNIAYARWGEGREPVVYVPPWVSNVELMWELPEFARTYERGGRYGDVIMIDKRGVGMSDRTTTAPTLEDRVSDSLAVLDAEGIESAHFVGFSEGAAIAAAVAARHADRTRSIVLYGAALPGVGREDILACQEPDDPPVASIRRIREVVANWGRPGNATLRYFAPSAAGNQRIEDWQARYERLSASPGALAAHLESAMSGDIRPDLDRITCPVLVAHSRSDGVLPVANSRYLAKRLPHSELKIWDSPDHVVEFSPNWAEIQADMIDFLTGQRPAPEVSSRFAVVVFTDIVGSTTAAANHGDDAWSKLIAAHDATADLVVDAHGGRRVKSTGDGMLAIFGDPAQALSAARRLTDQVTRLGIEIRIGVHAGQVQEQVDGDVIGTAVNIAARIEPHAPTGRCAVSRTIVDLMIGEDTQFESLGEHDLKGLNTPLELFAVVD